MIKKLLFAFLSIALTFNLVANELPSYERVQKLLKQIVKEENGGFALNMWASIVNKDGIVQLVTFSGENRASQWPGSRLISAQKANTANAFSLPKLSLSTANLFSATQSYGSLYGLQFSNPININVAYSGKSEKIGQKNDPLVGKKIGGVNIFGGGLALYTKNGDLVGALGVSGDSSCADHNIAWKLRKALKLDYVPNGVSKNKDDNIIYDIEQNKSKSAWGHPTCSKKAKEIAQNFIKTHPISKR